MITLNVGDTAYANFTKYSRVDVRKGTVIAKSATGVVRIDFGRSEPVSFLANGKQRGVDFYTAACLIDAEQFNRATAQAIVQRAEATAKVAIKNVSAIHCTTANKADVIDRLNAALAAVNAL